MDNRLTVYLAALATTLCLAGACIPRPPEGRLRCVDGTDCPSGWSCHDDHLCYMQPMAANGGAGGDTSYAGPDGGTSPVEHGPAGADAGALTDATDSSHAQMPTSSGGGGAAGVGGAGGAGGASMPTGGSGMPVSGGPAPAPQLIAVGANGCSASNTLCERAGECVDDRCLIVVCEGAGTFCDGPAECCDLACNGGVCKCGNHSASCSATTSPCCDGLYCETGQCANCKPQGQSCAGAYQCCGTTDCYQGTCQCRPEGAVCDSQSVCCAGTRCDGGKCACRAEGQACDSTSVCCAGSACSSGMCVASTATPIKQITPIKRLPGLWFCSLAAIGASCSTSADCCSQNCFDGKCVEACHKVGEAADVDSLCCSRLRADGKCAYAGCTKMGMACTAHQNCCSGRCTSGLCTAP